MRQDTGVDGDAQRLSQLGWMLFLKILDDREEEYEIERDYYRPPSRQSSAGAPGRQTRRASPATSSPTLSPPRSFPPSRSSPPTPPAIP